MRHGTSFDVDGNYTDSHGQSQVGFAITRLLGFELLPRVKQIKKARLYQADPGDRSLYPGLLPALTRPIGWDRIAEQYDQMIKYATAIRTGSAFAGAILRRFTQANAVHPTYQAMIELGRAQKTIFLCRYLRARDLQREIQEGLNVVESWNRGTQVVFFGKGGDIPSNPRDEQEPSILCLRVLKSAPVYINTLMLQYELGQPRWGEVLTVEDKRGLTPLIWAHVSPPARSGSTCKTASSSPHDPARSTTAPYAGQAQSTRALQTPPSRTPRLRLSQTGVPSPSERARRRGRACAEEAPARPDRAGGPCLLRGGLERSPRHGYGDDQDAALHRGARLRARPHPHRRRQPRQLPNPHQPRQRLKGPLRPIPAAFKETLALHIDAQHRAGGSHLFESSWKKPYSDRGVRKILARHATAGVVTGPISPHRLRHFLFSWLKTQGIDDALIQPYSGHATRKSLEIYSRIALADAQDAYDQAITSYPV